MVPWGKERLKFESVSYGYVFCIFYKAVNGSSKMPPSVPSEHISQTSVN
jgi:hypothetical protein